MARPVAQNTKVWAAFCAAVMLMLAAAVAAPSPAQDAAASQDAPNPAREVSRAAGAAEEVVIDFEDQEPRPDPTNDEVVNRVEVFTAQGVEFKLARQPQRSAARGRVMFFPHISSGRKGILNAMAEEQDIPVQVRFPHGASAVTIVFWASTGAAARLEAFNSAGEVVARDGVDVVPGRTRPEDPVPTFELSVRADQIAYVEFSGTRTGEFLAADEVRFTPLPAADEASGEP